MIAVLPIAAGLLAILSDDETPDLDDLFHRAVAFENPKILFDAMTPEQASPFLVWLYEWANDRKLSQNEREDRKKIRDRFFDNAPAYTVFRATDQQSPSPGCFSLNSDSTIPGYVPGSRSFIDCISLTPKSGSMQIWAFNFNFDKKIKAFLDSHGYSLMRSEVVDVNCIRSASPDAIFEALRYGISIIVINVKGLGNYWVILSKLNNEDVRPLWAREYPR
jgi:hypothetical protein